MRFQYTFLCCVLFLMCIFCAGVLKAQEITEENALVNYAYAVIFGTGVYEVNGQTAFILRAPLSYTIRETSSDQFGIQLLLPALVGYYDYSYDKAFKGKLPGEAASVSFVPGVELEYELSERWYVKPFTQVGIGRDLKNNVSTLVYRGGVTSKYTIPNQGKWRFLLGTELAVAGYKTESVSNDTMGIIALGIDAVYPWGVSLLGVETSIANYLTYYWYLDSLNFLEETYFSEKVSGEFEWGIALGFEEPLEILGLELHRIGLGFRYGDDIKGIRIISDFPF